MDHYFSKQQNILILDEDGANFEGEPERESANIRIIDDGAEDDASAEQSRSSERHTN